jgi:hypothetical protein
MVSLKLHRPATVHKADKPQVVMAPELHPPTSLNTEECHNQLVLNPLDQCRPNTVNFRSLLSRVVTVDHLFNLPLNTLNLRWLTEVLPVLVVMVAVNSSRQLLSGIPLLHKALVTALVVTKVKHTILMCSGHDFLTF